MLLRRLSLGLLLATLLLTGCGVAPSPSTTVALPAHMNGIVHGGQQPVAYSTIQLYTVGTSADGSASTPILTQTVTSDINGNFSLTGLYNNCAGATYVYITATGGNPLPGQGNPNLAMMTALGPCTSLTPSTFITINEVTTVAAVAALYPYMTSYTAVGSGSSDAVALASAFTLASEFVDNTFGVAPGSPIPSGMAVPTSEIYTLANILAACINTTGGSYGDNGTICGQLFSLTKPSGAAATNTIDSLLDLQKNPTLNVAQLFLLSSSTSPFQPQLTAAPATFRVALSGAPLLLNPTSLTYASLPDGTASTQTVTLANTTSAAVSLSGITITGANSADFSETNNCPSALGQGGLCSLQVTFLPSVVGAESATLLVAGGGSISSLPLSGMGVASSTGPVTLSTTSLSFYEVNASQSILLSNYGSAPLGISSISLSNTAFTQVNDCGSVLSAQSLCTIYVTANASYAGTSATLTINSSTGTPLSASVSYAGTTSLGTRIDFNIQTPTASGATVSFYGGTPTTISGIQFYIYTLNYSSNYYLYLGGYQNGCISRSGYCTFYLTMSVQNPTVSRRYYETDSDNAGALYLLTGYYASATKNFFLGTNSLTFPATPIGSSSTATVYAFNGSTQTLTLGTPIFTGGSNNNNEFSSYTDECYNTGITSGTLVPDVGGSYGYFGYCRITVTFTPKSAGTRSATMTVPEASGLQQLVRLQGVGAFAGPSLASTVPFGTVPVGTTSAVVPVAVTLPSAHAATAAISGTNASLFNLSGPGFCAGGGTPCSFGLTFSPTAGTAATATLTVTDTSTGLSSTATLTGTGGSASLSISPTSLTFAPRTVSQQSLPQSITVTNSGSTTLTPTAISITGTNPGDYAQTNTCVGMSIAPGGTCSISVTNTPTFVGPSSANIVLSSNAVSSPNLIPLSGTGQ